MGRGNLSGRYVMNGGKLGTVSEERDLGVRITSDLKTSAHCAFVCSRANRLLGMIRRTVVFRSPDVLTRLYKSLVRQHLEYCVSAWSPHYVKDKERLERVQRRFTRMVPGLKGFDYERRLERLKLMSLEERRNRSDLIEMFKISKGESAIPRNSFFRADTNERTRGHSRKLANDNFRLDVRKYFFSQRIVRRWNSLSEEVISAGSVNTFKKRLEELRKLNQSHLWIDVRWDQGRLGSALVRPNQVNDQVIEQFWKTAQNADISLFFFLLKPYDRLFWFCSSPFFVKFETYYANDNYISETITTIKTTYVPFGSVIIAIDESENRTRLSLTVSEIIDRKHIALNGERVISLFLLFLLFLLPPKARPRISSYRNGPILEISTSYPS